MANLLFNGDFQTGTKQQYYLEQAAPAESYPPKEPGDERVYIVNDAPAGTNLKYACEFKYVPGDPLIAASKRAELQQKEPFIYPGAHVWSVRWVKVMENDPTHFMLMHQWHENEEPTGVAFGLYLEGTTLYFEPGTGSAWWTHTFPGKEVWFQIKTHVYVHPTEGVVEVWYGLENEPLTKQTLTNGKTTYEKTNTLYAYGALSGKTAKRVYEKIGFNLSTSATGTSRVRHSGNLMYDGDPGEPYAPEPEPLPEPETTAGQILEYVRSLGYERDTEAQQLLMLNQVHKRIINSRRWTFLLDTMSEQTIAGSETTQFDTLAATKRIDAVRIPEHELEYLETPVLRQYVHDNNQIGVPEYWGRMGQNILLYPIPNATYTLTLDTVQNPIHIKNATDFVQIPSSHTDILVWGVIMAITFRERDWDGHNFARQMYAELFTEMLAQYGMKQRGSATHVVSSGQNEAFDVEEAFGAF